MVSQITCCLCVFKILLQNKVLEDVCKGYDLTQSSACGLP